MMPWFRRLLGLDDPNRETDAPATTCPDPEPSPSELRFEQVKQDAVDKIKAADRQTKTARAVIRQVGSRRSRNALANALANREG